MTAIILFGCLGILAYCGTQMWFGVSDWLSWRHYRRIQGGRKERKS